MREGILVVEEKYFMSTLMERDQNIKNNVDETFLVVPLQIINLPPVNKGLRHLIRKQF